jgi:SAM-dependent methyltransferase
MSQAAVESDLGYAEVREHFDRYAGEADHWEERTAGYHLPIRSLYRSLIPREASVLEIGCGRGDLLADLGPARGVGVDLSTAMVEAARERHPGLEFICTTGERLDLGETFDYVVLSDVVPYVDDLQALMDAVAAHCHRNTRVVVSTSSNLWRGPLWLMQRLGLRPERPVRNWVAPRDLANLFELAGFEPLAERREILVPMRPGRLAAVVNGVVARLPLLRSLTLTYWLIARPAPQAARELGVTVVVPCRNEAGNIDAIVERTPDMGSATEILFAEGGSSDDTRARVEQAIAGSERDMSLIVQTGKGKANAVHEAFAIAKHEILMILDADLTVPPEDLPKFYEALASGRGELINGSRLVYGMEPGAMRFLNMIANRLFAILMSTILGQYVKDTLCGTKALHRDDYRKMMAKRHEIGPEDPYGDYDFLLGASILGLKILNVPVRYRARTYGETNIERFSGGGMLAKLAAAGFRRIWIRPLER